MCLRLDFLKTKKVPASASNPLFFGAKGLLNGIASEFFTGFIEGKDVF